MCTGLELMAAGMAAGTAASTLMQPKMPSINIPTPEKPPESQAAKAPSRAAMGDATKNAVAGAPGMGNGGTFLTGPSGIDPSTLNLGKNTLLGQ